MQNKRKDIKVEPVRKPILYGSWNGKDARKLALRRVLSLLGVSLIYFMAGLFISFDLVWLRIFMLAVIVFSVLYYQYCVGMSKGENDAAFGEILYNRKEEGKQILSDELQRSFHRGKGFFAAFLGALPYVIIALVFACMAQKTTYQLGMLPSWTQDLLYQTEFGTALAYYGEQAGMGFADVLRVIVRVMVMPFINISLTIGDDATLFVERISPILILLAPFAYGLGYTQGLNARIKVNTGIRMGVEKKKRRERKARKQRQKAHTVKKGPERLI